MKSNTQDKQPVSGADRRKEIAAAARSLIAERGFEGLRTRDIAERVGINIATLHYHVPTKEALIGLVAQSLRDDFIAQHQGRPRESLSPRELLISEFEDFRQNLTGGAELFKVMAELQERAKRDPEIAAVVRPMQGYWFAQVSEILSLGRADGSFRPDLDPEAGALMVIGSMIASQRHPQASIESLERVCAELLRAFEARTASQAKQTHPSTRTAAIAPKKRKRSAMETR